MAVPKLVEFKWLKDKIESGNLGNIVILDVSWSSKKDAYEDYKKEHILGARHINIHQEPQTDYLVRNIPTPEHFKEIVQKAGVNKTSHVIVYSNSDRAGFFLAGRGWWTFRIYGFKNVSILNGSFTEWVKLNFPTESGAPDVQRGDFEPDTSKSLYKEYKDVLQNDPDSPKFQLVDTRDGGQYQNAHIPGAKNLFMTNLIDEENSTLKSKEQLEEAFKEAQVDLNKPVVVHCNGGMSSCTVAFAAELLGQDNIAVFHGGFIEWSKRQEEENSQTSK